MENKEEVNSSIAPGVCNNNKKKFEDRNRKKDSRSWENISKKLSELENSDVKLKFIEEKYCDLYNEYRKIFTTLSTSEKRVTGLQKEKEQLQSDLGKVILVRSRLENLCRELQKQCKQIKEESMARIKIEEERRREVSSKFADKLTDINNLMEESKDKGDRLTQENKAMTEKLTELYKEFQKREKDIGLVSKELETEKKYHKEAIKKLELELASQKHNILKEQMRLQTSLEQSEANCQVLMNTVKGLQGTIDVYKTQYQDFESTMNKSDEVLGFFKVEMERLNKQVKNFEDEAKNWRKKYQDSVNKIIDLSQNNQLQEQLLGINEKKVDKLQKLCRQLQAERSAYLKVLKDNNIEPPIGVIPESPSSTLLKQQQPLPPPPSSPTKTKAFKTTKKEKELASLKDHLKDLQNQLDLFSREKTEEKPEKNMSKKDINIDIVKDISNVSQVETNEIVEKLSNDSYENFDSDTVSVDEILMDADLDNIQTLTALRAQIVDSYSMDSKERDVVVQVPEILKEIEEGIETQKGQLMSDKLVEEKRKNDKEEKKSMDGLEKVKEVEVLEEKYKD